MPVSLVATKFDVYKDEDSPVIYDIDEYYGKINII